MEKIANSFGSESPVYAKMQEYRIGYYSFSAMSIALTVHVVGAIFWVFLSIAQAYRFIDAVLGW